MEEDHKVHLREWAPLTPFLSKIPLKAQKGLNTLDLKFTCVAALEEFLVLGTNVGILYWFNRKTEKLDRLRTLNTDCPIHAIAITHSTLDFLLAVGNAEGAITVFLVPKKVVRRNEVNNPPPTTTAGIQRLIYNTLLLDQEISLDSQSERVDISDVHKCQVTSLEWNISSVIQLFSGDVDGFVSLTEIDFLKDEEGEGNRKVTSGLIVQENSEIVQLSYWSQNLLICSKFQCIVFSLDKNEYSKVGTQERKMEGRFGGLFCKEKSTGDENGLRLYSARPGGRLWIADGSGIVEQTIKFKDLLLDDQLVPSIPVMNPFPSAKPTVQEFQLGILHHYSTPSCLVTSHKNAIYLLDPSNTKILGVCYELRGILSIAVNNHEIFVLETHRNLIRLSVQPDSYFIASASHSSDFLRNIPTSIPIQKLMSTSISDFRLDMEQPFNFLSSKIKQTSKRVLENPRIDMKPANLMRTLKQVIEADVDVLDGQRLVTVSVPDESGKEMEETFIPELNVPDEAEHTPVPDKFQHISQMPFDEDLLIPVKRGGRRRKKKRALIQSSSDTVSLTSSIYSTKSEDLEDPMSTSLSQAEGINDINDQNPHKINGSVTDKNDALSQSWTVGQHEPSTSQHLLLPDLESKEEFLAKKLNWPELLPGGSDSNTSPQIQLDNLKNDNDDINEETLNTQFDNTNESVNTNSNAPDSCSLITVKNYAGHDFTDGQCSRNVSMSSTTAEEAKSLEESIDIYTKYAPKDDNNATPLVPSSLTFGPPSSIYSNHSSGFSMGLTTPNGGLIQAKVVEVSESSLSTSPEERVSLSPSDLVPVRDMLVQPVTQMVNHGWIQFEVPAPLQSLAVCDKFIVCTDSKDHVYVSELGHSTLRWIQTKYRASQVAVSSCGSVLWRIRKGVLYSLPNADFKTTVVQGSVWSKLMDNVVHFAVQAHVGWIVQKDGRLYVCSGLLSTAVVPDFERISTPFLVARIVAEDYKIWALSQDGRLFFRNGVSDDSPYGVQWIEKYFEYALSAQASAISLGPVQSLWIGDVHNNLYFVEGISAGSSKKDMQAYYEGKPFHWRVNLLSTSSGSSEPSPQQSLSSGSTSVYSSPFSLSSLKSRLNESLIKISQKGSERPLIAGTYSSVWFAMTGASKLYFSNSLVEGHGWTSLRVHRPLRQSAWSSVLAGGIYGDNGFLLLMDHKSKLLFCDPNGGEAKAIDLPSSKTCSVTTAPDTLWILTHDGVIYSRTNISHLTPLGHGWGKIDLSLKERNSLVHVSCGSDIAWGVDSLGNVFMRNPGSLRPPGPNDICPAWIHVEDDVDAVDSTPSNRLITKVFVGPSGNLVWALDSKNNIYVREAVYPDFPIGIRWLMVPSIEATNLCLSENAVWALSPKGEIFRRFGISSTNFVGDYWKKIPGPFDSPVRAISVSVCDQLWALDCNGQIVKHSQRSLNFREKYRPPKPSVELDPEDKDWEVINSVDVF